VEQNRLNYSEFPTNLKKRKQEVSIFSYYNKICQNITSEVGSYSSLFICSLESEKKRDIAGEDLSHAW